MSDQADTSFGSDRIIVGIGASAGGLEAFQMFLKGLPEDHGMVLVLVQHLDPDHVSLMPELVANKTKSPVHSVEDNMAVEPGHIYLIPPGYEMELRDGHLRLEEFKSPRGLRRPIDRFFRSLARAQRDTGAATDRCTPASAVSTQIEGVSAVAGVLHQEGVRDSRAGCAFLRTSYRSDRYAVGLRDGVVHAVRVSYDTVRRVSR